MRIALLLFIVLFSLCCQPTLIIPNARKDEIFTDSINTITDKFELSKLRENYFSGDDFEVRVWVTGFEIDGFILRSCFKTIFFAHEIHERHEKIKPNQNNCSFFVFFVYFVGKILSFKTAS